MNRRIYLDHNATTPLAPEVVAAMRPFLEEAYGNPSSLHWAGVPARDAVERARSQVASLLCCDATEVVFTAGGTEANNHAITGAYFARRGRVSTPHIIVSQIEHPAVLEPCRFLESLGARVTLVPVDRCGLVDPDDIRRAIGSDTILVSIMHANNEVGSVQPIEEIARIARDHDVLCHTDAAQSVGKITVDVEALGVDLLSVAGHKLYGPKGVGALFVREGVELVPLLHGAGHEAGRRAGTENVLGIVGLGAACSVSQRWIAEPHIRDLRNRFWQNLYAACGDGVVLNGDLMHGLPNTLSVGFRGSSGNAILARLPNVAASTGSACHAGAITISPVLAAMHVPEDVALGTIRFSLGRGTTVDELDHVVAALVEILR
ncbi:cysteine desulfurase family protein [Planctellipticum variicoloris]|uniref:cysteine desulfurase family protein n=1 Tax=Planctellipticum variicoloris TaxID=3064265 RepID=UPI0030133D51|nr:cysteine desulfurase [Planctomycetaceae bacterium SH412]